MEIKELDNGYILNIYEDHEEDFWSVMGKYFAFRDWAHEMGGWQFYSKPGSKWFVLLRKTNTGNGNTVAGFCSIINERTHNYFDNFYVMPEYRGAGLSRILWDERWAKANSLEREIRVISDNPIQIRRYESYGMEFYGMRGRYRKYRKTFKQH